MWTNFKDVKQDIEEGSKETYGNFMRKTEDRCLLELLREKIKIMDDEIHNKQA